jgi:hypothetical protein
MWIIDELKAEWETMKRVVKKLKRPYIKRPYRRKIIKERKTMTDAEFQAGLPAAIEAAFVAYVASTGFAATLVAGASTVAYVPAPTAVPPTETVTF